MPTDSDQSIDSDQFRVPDLTAATAIIVPEQPNAERVNDLVDEPSIVLFSIDAVDEPAPESELSAPAQAQAEDTKPDEVSEPARHLAASEANPDTPQTATEPTTTVDTTTTTDTTTTDTGVAEAVLDGPTTHGLGSPEVAPVEPEPTVAPVEAGGLRSGELVTCAVSAVDSNEVVLDLPDGRKGVVNRRHLSIDGKADPTEVCHIGDEIEVAVLVREDRENRVVLSRSWALKQRAWQRVEESLANGTPLTGTVVEQVKGGLGVDIGLRAFLPASHIDLHHVENPSSLVGQELEVLVAEADRVTDKVVLSRRNWLRQLDRKRAAELVASLEPGQTRRGRVVTVTDFGAFVDLGGVRGLLHLSELSWNRVERVSDVVKVGDEIDVKILALKGGSKRVSLSMRAAQPDPLAGLVEGQRLLGVVTRLVDFGAFVRVLDRIEGLVHVSELAEYRVHLPEEVVTPGDEVWVKVLRIDRRRRRVDLSVNQAVQY